MSRREIPKSRGVRLPTARWPVWPIINVRDREVAVIVSTNRRKRTHHTKYLTASGSAYYRRRCRQCHEVRAGCECIKYGLSIQACRDRVFAGVRGQFDVAVVAVETIFESMGFASHNPFCKTRSNNGSQKRLRIAVVAE